MPAPLVSAHPMPISIATPSRDMTFTSTKGLLNGPGQNNCFLNSAVQVLWHLDIFRRSFRDLSGHACMADSCIFCALKELFSQLQFSNETALPPDALRRALAESFFDQQRFQLGFMDDAAECFENMLLRIHMHIAHGEAEDMCNARHCIPHQKFAMTLVEQSVCGSCGATSEPLSYTQMVHYVSTSTLVFQVRTNPTRQGLEPFGQLLRKAGGMGDVRVCPSACGAVIQIGRTLMNRPEIVSIGLVWNSERPTLEHIMEVFSTIGTTLRLSDVFNKVVDNRWAETCTHNLVGVVTYYGKHYSTFFFHTKLRVWIYFDDATVREVGPRWEQVVEKCRKGRYQPLLLLYASPDGTPVNTENAPKQVTPFYNETTPKTITKKLSPGGGVPTHHQSLSLMRRSITPSPEKPNLGNSNTRRAITPNPDSSQKPPLPRPAALYNEYQNLSVIQSNLYNNNNRSVDCVDGKEPEYVTKKDFGINLNKPNVHRTLSNGSSSGVETCFRDYLNLPRTRDSGNWSSDRNSSSSSTTMENPYLYMVKNHDNPGVVLPNTGCLRAESSSSNGSGAYDVGYDSYSLSSNDSSTMTTIQHLMKMGHLAKIPEDYNNSQPTQMVSCDVLCDEADELLVKSRQLEDDHDLVLALALCNAAATKARAAMDAPYNNPQTLTLARMKHNTCIMRARSLHRRMTQNQNPQLIGTKDGSTQPEIRHTREGSSGSGKHSRQSSRDKSGNHSRQNSRELLLIQPIESKPVQQPQPRKSIEIYATLPKKKDGLKKIVNIEDDYALYDKPPGRESRSIFSRSKNKEANKVREKRSRSEDRNKMTRDLSIAPEITFNKDTLKKEKVKEDTKEDKKEKDGKGKKQHKIRRKLLMGGLIRRKNRSMPDLTDANVDKEQNKPSGTVDDSKVGLNKENAASMCGYLSEGHLEFTGSNTTNPNLERSKLMRKSFHGSAGKILTAAKVPPPPPLRTSSQLSSQPKLTNGGEECEDIGRPKSYFPHENHYGNYSQMLAYCAPPQVHPAYQPVRYNTPDSNMVVTKADVHQEQTPPKTEICLSTYNREQEDEDPGVDEVDCLPSAHHLLPLPDLPPYPSPQSSALHSRQASEEFPPPPPPLDLSALDEHLPKVTKELSPSPIPSPGSLLAQLQNKRQEILSQDVVRQTYDPPKSSGDTWLKELQAKQAALRMKKGQSSDGGGEYCTKKSGAGDEITKASPSSSVKDLANKFESNNIQVQPLEVNNMNATSIARSVNLSNSQPFMEIETNNNKRVPPEQIAEEIREVEMIQKSINTRTEAIEEAKRINKAAGGKKKSVSFCDQVILVAATEEQEDDSYNRNPLLEKILKYAAKEEVQALKAPEAPSPQPEVSYSPVPVNNSNEEWLLNQQLSPLQPPQPVYASWRRNSVENLLTRQNSFASTTTTDSDGNYLQDPRQIYGTSPQIPGQNLNRQSPYQRIPQNSPIYMYNNQTMKPQVSPHYPNNNNQMVPPQYGRPPQPQMMRQSPQQYPVYQHPPSPAPSTLSANYNYQQNCQPQHQMRQQSPIYDHRGQYSPYQHPPDHHQPQNYQHPYPAYQQIPHQPPHPQYNYVQDNQIINNNGSLPRMAPAALDGGNYHRVPPPHGEVEYIQKTYPAYQHALPPKQLLKKTVSFEPGTKGGAESPIPKAVVTPIIVNNANNSVPTGKTKCNLCRKKAVVSTNLYCTDCEFYMSRFKPKR